MAINFDPNRKTQTINGNDTAAPVESVQTEGDAPQVDNGSKFTTEAFPKLEKTAQTPYAARLYGIKEPSGQIVNELLWDRLISQEGKISFLEEHPKFNNLSDQEFAKLYYDRAETMMDLDKAGVWYSGVSGGGLSVGVAPLTKAHPVDDLEKAHELDPQNYSIKFRLGEAYLNRAYSEKDNEYTGKDDLSKALEQFEPLYKSREDVGAAYNMAICYRSLGDYEKAIKYYQVYLAAHPNSTETSLMIAECYEKLHE